MRIRYSDAVDDFLRVKRRKGLSAVTIGDYRKLLTKFGEGREYLDSIDRRDYEAYIDAMLDRGVKPETVNHHYRTLKVFARWVHDEGLVTVNEFARIEPVKEDRRLKTNLLSRKDFDALVATCDTKSLLGRRDAAILHFLYETGVRVGELCRLKTADVDLDAGRAKVFGKGAKERMVFFGNKTGMALTRWRMRVKRHTDTEVFFVSRSLHPLNQNAVNLMLRRRAEDAGVTADVNPHAFRHAFATNYLRAGGDLNSLQRLLGHSSLAIVSRYLSLVDDDLAAKHSQFSPLR